MVKGKLYNLFNIIIIGLTIFLLPYLLLSISVSYLFLGTTDDYGVPVNNYIHYKELALQLISLIGAIISIILTIAFYKRKKTYKEKKHFIFHFFIVILSIIEPITLLIYILIQFIHM